MYKWLVFFFAGFFNIDIFDLFLAHTNIYSYENT